MNAWWLVGGAVALIGGAAYYQHRRRQQDPTVGQAVDAALNELIETTESVTEATAATKERVVREMQEAAEAAVEAAPTVSQKAALIARDTGLPITSVVRLPATEAVPYVAPESLKGIF